jgi:hypothetical protein
MEGERLLQAAIVAKLKADAGVVAMLTSIDWTSDNSGSLPAIWDKPGGALPETYPCVILGESQRLAEDALIGPASSWGYRVARIFVTLHVWTRITTVVLDDRRRAGGLAETKRIGAAVEKALHGDVTVYPDGLPVSLMFDSARYMHDPDGQSGHGVLVFSALLTEAQ